MGGLQSIRNTVMNVEYHPNKNIHRYKGLTYDEDGVTIIDSIFQRIADGDIPPGKSKPRNATLGYTASTIECQRMNNKENELLYQDEQVAAFYTLDSACDEGHILVVPRARPFQQGHREMFLESCLDLKATDEDILLLQRMKYAGEEAMKEHRRSASCNSDEKLKMIKKEDGNIYYYFHVPPFTSISHLHLHVLYSDRRNSFKNYVKFPPWFDTMWCIRLKSVMSSLDSINRK